MKTSALSILANRTHEPPISWLMSHVLAHPQIISLAVGFTDSETLPRQEVRKLMSTLLDSKKSGEAALQYGTTPGDRRLRQLTAQRLATAEGLKRQPDWAERMVLTNGSQQVLYIVSEMLCDAGDIVLVEDPTYFVYLGIVQSHGLRARGVRMSAEGLDLAHLEEVLETLKRKGELPRLKLLYTVSYFQNPTGLTATFENKKAVFKLLRRYEKAAGHPIYLLEDAAYRELRFEGGEIPSTLTLPGAAQRVIYTGTYSKPFATGARVGFGVFPKPLLAPVLRIKGNHDFGTSNLLQQLLRRALESGLYEKHLAVLRSRYERKAQIMAKALAHYMPSSVEYRRPQGGLYFWARLPQQVSTGLDSPLFRAALKREVLYVPGELCYAADPARPKPGHEMRLSFGGAADKNIQLGIERLAGAIGAQLGRR